MPFVISDPNKEEEEVEVSMQGQQQQPEQPQSGFVVSEPSEDEETSYLRGAGGAIQDFVMKAFDIGVRALGGGPDSPMGRQERWKREGKPHLERIIKTWDLQAEGKSDEEIAEILGPEPEPEKVIQTFTELGDIITGGKLVPKTGTERTMRKAGGTGGEFVMLNAMLPGLGSAAGAGEVTAANVGKEAMVGGLFGAGEQLAEEAGGGPLSQFLSGLGLASMPGLIKSGVKGLDKGIEFGRKLLGSEKIPEGMPKFLTEVSEKGLADLELSSRDLTGRVAKTSEEMLGKFEESVSKVAEPTMKDVGTFRAADIENEIVKANQKSILNRISPAAETQKKSWEGLQKYVDGNFNAIKETYSKLYEAVEQGAKGLNVVPNNTFEIATKVVEDLERSIIKAPEEGGVKGALQQLVDMLKPMKDGNLVEIPLEQLMAGKRSINRLLEKSGIIPAPVDLLKPVSRAMKLDTLKALESRPSIKKMFEAAENQFGEAQRVFNNDAMVKMRKSQNPEDLTSMFTKPSNLERLKESLGGDQRVSDFVDRLVVENISNKNKSLAREMANETREYLGSKGKDGLDKILEYGDSLSTPGQQALARGNVLQDMQKAFDTGARPDTTLKMMQNPVGYDIVKDTMNRSPKGRQMFKSLQKSTFEDMVSSVLDKEKQIDFEKAKDILSNPHMKTVVKEAMGPEGLEFFQKMEKYGQNMATNMKNLALKDKPLFQRLMDNYFDKGLKYSLYAMAPFTLGKSLLPILGADVAKRAYRARLFNVLESPQARSLVKQMGQRNISPEKMARLMKRFAQVAGRPGKDED